MRYIAGSLLACTAAAGLGGCSWAPYLARNVGNEPLEAVEKTVFAGETRRLANQAWVHTLATAETPYSPAYADGFKRGFADQVRRNGPCEPPTYPPCRYRYPILRSPEQQQEITDWYAGFRHGAQVASQEGWRQGVVVPMSRPPLPAPLGVYYHELIPTPPIPPADPPRLPPRFEELPPPRAEPLDLPAARQPAPAAPPATPRPAAPPAAGAVPINAEWHASPTMPGAS